MRFSAQLAEQERVGEASIALKLSLRQRVEGSGLGWGEPARAGLSLSPSYRVTPWLKAAWRRLTVYPEPNPVSPAIIHKETRLRFGCPGVAAQLLWGAGARGELAAC